MKTAIQLYTFRFSIMSDLHGHLSHLRSLGFEGAELVDLGGGALTQTVDEMNRLGLEVFSLHVGVDQLLRCDASEAKGFAELGCRYLPIGWLPAERLAGGALYGETLCAIREYAAVCRRYGLTLLYHNHEFDFERADGRRKLDVLYADTDPDDLKAELDTCWIYTGGEDPLDYMRRYANRCPVLHLKDCVREGGRKGYMPLGEGVLDFAPMVREASSLDVEWLCVEQDDPTPGLTPMECTERSMAHLCSLLGR